MESGSHEEKDSHRLERMKSIFRTAKFIDELGIELVDYGRGWCETVLETRAGLLQQNGFVHAGVIASMADHTAGAASGTVAPLDVMVLTVEYKINLLRPGVGESLRCRADVIKPGKTIIVVESEVFATNAGEEKLIAKAMVTIAAVGMDGQVVQRGR